MALRKNLREEGFFVLAPCTHQETCPLLEESKRDWCHNRTPSQMPTWFEEVENHLPMKNRTVTYSYLILNKNKPEKATPQQARVIGDTLKEKGKVKQLICRGPKREFISWLTKKGAPPFIERGSLITIPEDAEVRERTTIESIIYQVPDCGI